MDEMRSKAKTDNMGFVLERLTFGHFGGADYVTPEALQRLKLMVDEIYSQFTVAMVSRLWPHLAKFNDRSFSAVAFFGFGQILGMEKYSKIFECQ